MSGDIEKEDYLNALLISAEGICELAERYTKEAERLAEEEQDERRKNLEGRLRHHTAHEDINLGGMIEFVMTNGVNRKSGRKVSVETGSPEAFETYEEFENAVEEQLHYAIRAVVKGSHVIDNVCMDRVVDLINSMATVKNLVYDTEQISMKDLVLALDADFAGYDAIKKLCDDAPKYGTDNEITNEIAGEMFTFIANEIESYRSKFGTITSGILPVSGKTPFRTGNPSEYED